MTARPAGRHPCHERQYGIVAAVDGSVHGVNDTSSQNREGSSCTHGKCRRQKLACRIWSNWPKAKDSRTLRRPRQDPRRPRPRSWRFRCCLTKPARMSVRYCPGAFFSEPPLAHARALAEALERILGGSVRLAGNRWGCATGSPFPAVRDTSQSVQQSRQASRRGHCRAGTIDGRRHSGRTLTFCNRSIAFRVCSRSGFSPISQHGSMA